VNIIKPEPSGTLQGRKDLRKAISMKLMQTEAIRQVRGVSSRIMFTSFSWNGAEEYRIHGTL
jgi:hypothetical protein